MSTVSPLSETLRRALMHPTNGVVGLVDELLQASRAHGLQLDWQADRCRVVTLGREGEEIDVPLRKSVFRAILARLAVLCNERCPNSVSPYGGEGELSVGLNPETVFRVSFVNTPDEQKAELMPVCPKANGPN